MSRRPLTALLTLVALGLGCAPGDEEPSTSPSASAPRGATESAQPHFVEVTAESGIDFVHNTGAFGEKWLPETMGSGVVLFDQNGDDRLDILFLNGTRFDGRPGEATTQRFYRNLGGWRFVDATAEVGLDIEAYCLGGAAADLDNDGDTDLYMSCLGRDRLLINEGERFVDRSREAGLPDEYEFGASVAVFDADRDGWLDILATRYVTWTPETDLFCTLDGKTKSYCTPESYPGASPRYLHNLGDGRFEDRTEEAGFFAPDAKSLGVSVLDLDGDGWLDVAIANDTQPNLLYHNLGDGTFEEIGVLSGMAFSETGVARGGMGIDAADYDRSGRQSLVIGNFANEMVALYRNEGNQLFVDVAPTSELGRDTLLSLTFGTFFFDYDLDGWLDLFIANGHLDAEVEVVQTKVRYRQPAQIFRNTGEGRFVQASPEVVGDLAEPRVARGAAYGDLDGDGDLDVVLSNNGGPAAVFDNRGEHGRWLRVDLEGTTSNRDGIGAIVTLGAGGASQSWLVRTGSSYLSQSQVDAVFGLGAGADTVERLSVAWPSGSRSERTDLAPDSVVTLAE
ncbi:MAG: CRTAC1 family protein [Thermoanaerobaculia bacterium]|nr:CRTAC1 family protein [Thermoanaerobaculia bacterium]